MKPLALVKKYCCNYQDDGTCVGVSFKPNGEQYRFIPEGTKCLVACGQQCKHLHWAVLPMRFWEFNGSKPPFTPGDGKMFREGYDRYRRKHSGIEGLAPKQRKCPDCEAPIGPRRRYCANCAVDHIRKTHTNATRKYRAKTP